MRLFQKVCLLTSSCRGYRRRSIGTSGAECKSNPIPPATDPLFSRSISQDDLIGKGRKFPLARPAGRHLPLLQSTHHSILRETAWVI